MKSKFDPSIDEYGHVHLFGVTPVRPASELSENERRRLSAQFTPQLSRFRARRYAVTAVALVAILVSWFVLKGSSANQSLVWLILFAVTCFCIAVATRLPRCPWCSHRLNGRLGAYCPNWAAAALGPNAFHVPYCSACCTYITSGRGGRRYTIRACTNCGLMLDCRGL